MKHLLLTLLLSSLAFADSQPAKPETLVCKNKRADFAWVGADKCPASIYLSDMTLTTTTQTVAGKIVTRYDGQARFYDREVGNWITQVYQNARQYHSSSG